MRLPCGETGFLLGLKNDQSKIELVSKLQANYAVKREPQDGIQEERVGGFPRRKLALGTKEPAGGGYN